MKLHIGCGKKHISGWINLDIRSSAGVDIVDDAQKLEKIQDSSCDIIYASHILEHFGRHEFKNVIEVWHRKLKKGGILRISVPDFEKVVDYYNNKGDLNKLLGFLVGGQRNEFDYHKMIFDSNSLTKDLLGAGFDSVTTWDWKNTEHKEIDDYSQAYLPHLDKESGTLMSLNIEAIK